MAKTIVRSQVFFGFSEDTHFGDTETAFVRIPAVSIEAARCYAETFFHQEGLAGYDCDDCGWTRRIDVYSTEDMGDETPEQVFERDSFRHGTLAAVELKFRSL